MTIYFVLLFVVNFLCLIDALKYTFYATEWLGSGQFYDLSSHLVSIYCGKHSEMKVSPYVDCIAPPVVTMQEIVDATCLINLNYKRFLPTVYS